jgi:hypothetical protein
VWKWVAAGAALGAVGFVGYSMSKRPATAGAMPTQDIAANAIGGAGAGIAAASVLLALMGAGLKVGAIGAGVGIAALYAGMKLDTASTAIVKTA